MSRNRGFIKTTFIYNYGYNYIDFRIFEISISDGNDDPYTKGLLVESTAFTPDSSFPVLKTNQGGGVTIILEVSTPGDYHVAIGSFIDTKGQALPPAPDSTELRGKVLLTYNYAP